MRLLQELFKNGREQDGDFLPLPRMVIIPKKGGYFEGVKSVGDFSSERLVLYFSGDHMQSVEVEGARFTIGKYCDGDLQLLGEIATLRLPQNEKKQAAEKGED